MKLALALLAPVALVALAALPTFLVWHHVAALLCGR